MAFSCDEFFSHQNILLKEHLKDVGELCARYVQNCTFNEQLIEAAKLIGKTHDFAKYTEFFQMHLCGEKIRGHLSTHSRLSAISSAWIVNKRLADPFLSTATFLCVDCHHGYLENFNELYKTAKFLNEPLIRHQINSIRKNLKSIKGELEELDLGDLIDFLNDPERGMEEVKNVLENAEPLSWDEESGWRNYFTILLLYSSLVDADRKDAGKVYETLIVRQEREKIPADIIISYRKRKFGGSKHPIDKLREGIFISSEKNLEKILTEQPKIITITAPTGSGKTILGLYAALKIREIQSANGKIPRIIYSLPFINIIEQTHAVFNDVLLSRFDKITIDLLLKHHHLAFPESRFRNEEITLDKILLLTDAWDSEVIVTTFEQLIRSIIGSKGSLLRKFHNIANSIIILDEVQAIPLEYWKLIQEVLTELVKFFNVNIIMMTATRPIIFHGERELVPDHEEFFKGLNRFTIMSNVDKEMTPEEVVKFFFSKWDEKSSALIVLNTIKASKIVYEGISNRLGDNAIRLGSISDADALKDPSKSVLAYLSTSIVPCERKKRVNLIRDLLRDHRKVILVSTQVVEAGVDLDFDLTFRDIGPLDSIIQVSGRCNRNWRHKAGSQTYIIRVFDNKGRPEAEKIYGKILPNITIDMLKKKPIIKEEEILDLINDYYTKVLDSCNIGSEHLNYIRNLAYKDLSFFSLIREEPKISVFVEVNDRATTVLEKFRESLNKLASVGMNELFECKAELRKLRANLEDYTVNVWPSREIASLNEIVPKTGIYYVPRESLSAYYNRETGFIQESDDYGESQIW